MLSALLTRQLMPNAADRGARRQMIPPGAVQNCAAGLSVPSHQHRDCTPFPGYTAVSVMMTNTGQFHTLRRTEQAFLT